MFVVIFVVALIFSIMFHEFGHFITAKAFGMKVEKFFLFFGRTLWSFRRGETEYGVKTLPLGGFVKIVGMSPSEPIDPADQGRTFYEKPAWQRTIVLVAGSFTHFILAAVLIYAALTLIGLPQPPLAELDVVLEDGPGAAAGLLPGDRIVAVDGQPVERFEEVREAIAASEGRPMTFRVERNGEQMNYEITPTISERPDGTRGPFVGIGPKVVIAPVPPGEAARRTLVGDYSIVEITRSNIAGLGDALSPQALGAWFGQVGEPGPRTTDGPVSLVGVGQTVNALGRSGQIFELLFLFALLNITLGTLNMLPLPPLDGGHLAVLLIERGVNGVRQLRGRSTDWHMNPSVITPVALVVIVFFTVLTLTALYVDIVKPASQLLEQ
jgi:membrane-associated protease RseP (regulator of RpoE activity)